MTFTPRSAWADRHPGLSAARKGVGTAVVHHTVGAWSPGQNKAAWMRGLEHAVTDHVAPGNSAPLMAIDYNELIFPDGDVFEGRGLAYEDAATYHFNAESVSWALVGNYDVGEVPDAALHALAGRIRAAQAAGWLAAGATIEGHRDVHTFATACPGRFTEARMGELRALVNVGGGAPAPADDGEDDMYTDEDRARDNATALRAIDLQDHVAWISAQIKPQGKYNDGGKTRFDELADDIKASAKH